MRLLTLAPDGTLETDDPKEFLVTDGVGVSVSIYLTPITNLGQLRKRCEYECSL